jgi:hypothetical protein
MDCKTITIYKPLPGSWNPYELCLDPWRDLALDALLFSVAEGSNPNRAHRHVDDGKESAP